MSLLRSVVSDAFELSRAIRREQTNTNEDARVPLTGVVKVALFHKGYRVLLTTRVRESVRRWHVPVVDQVLRLVTRARYGIDVGDQIELGPGVHFPVRLGIVIDGTSKVGARVTFMGNNSVGRGDADGCPVLDDDVVIGSGAQLRGPIHIGKGAFIGANSVVASDVPPGAVVRGSPAKAYEPISSPDGVLSYWFGEEAIDEDPAALDRRLKVWFGGGPAADLDVRKNLGPLYERAARGELDHWRHSARGRLALILLLDQVPRQLHRGSAKAFAHDDKALELSDEGIRRGLDTELGVAERIFFNMPRGHSEDLETQRRAYAYVAKELFPTAHPMFRERFDDIARKHVEVLERFGRFPQRNAAIGRSATDEELGYLKRLEATRQPF